MIDAAFADPSGVEVVECAVGGIVKRRQFIGVLDHSTCVEHLVAVAVLVHVEIAGNDHGNTASQFGSFFYDEAGTFPACIHTNVVEMRVEKEKLEAGAFIRK